MARTCSALLALRKGLGMMTGERQASAWPSFVSTEKGMPSCHASTEGSSSCETPESADSIHAEWSGLLLMFSRPAESQQTQLLS